jgi:hypothetical protein
MAQSNRMSVQKRQREQKKAERAAQKREERRSPAKGERAERGTDVASASELESYGLPPAPFGDKRKE